MPASAHDPDHRRARGPGALALAAAALVGAWSAGARAADAPVAGPQPCPLLDPSHAVRIVVEIEDEDATSKVSALAETLRGALAKALESTSLPGGVVLDVRGGATKGPAPPPGAAVVRVRGGVLQVGELRLLALNVALDPGDDRPDLSVEVQDRVFSAAMSRDWLQLPAAVIDEAKLTSARAEGEASRAAGWSLSVSFLRGMIAYLAHRRLPPTCPAEAELLKTSAVTSLRRWDGPRQEEIAAEASAVAKQVRAFLEFDDDSCATFDGGEDPVRLLVAAARLAPHRPENRRLAVIAQLHRASHPPKLCGATLERDLLASVALAPADQATLHDAGLAYDVLAQGAPPPFAPGEEIDRVEALRQMRRVPPAYRPAVRGVVEVGLGGVVSVASSKAVAPGGKLELWLGPTVIPLALRGAVERTASRDIPFAVRGVASWRRDTVSLGVGYRLARRGLFVDLFADGALAAAHIDGSAFVDNRSTVNLDAGGGGGVRAGWSWRHVAVSAEVAGQLWAIPQWAEVEGIDDRHRLPSADLSVAVLVSLLSGLSVR
jgi:hypothetical protein